MARMKFKVGDVLYKCSSLYGDEGEIWVDLDEYRIWSIRKHRAFATEVVEGVTITKGVWATYIPEIHRRDFLLHDDGTAVTDLIDKQFSKSKAAALIKGLGAAEDVLHDMNADHAMYEPDEFELQKKIISRIKGMLTKERNKNAKSKKS